MQKSALPSVELAQLRVGMFVVLDMGWLAHPFPTGSFKLTQQSQIDTLRSIGLKAVHVDPARSDLPLPGSAGGDDNPLVAAQRAAKAAAAQLAAEQAARQALNRAERAQLLSAQQQQLAACEKRFSESARAYRVLVEQVASKPAECAQHCLDLVRGFVGDFASGEEASIRLLSESAGDKSGMHPVNVTVLCLLLGRSLALTDAQLQDLGVAAFIHDLGKQQLPDRVRHLTEGFTSAELRLYQEHVGYGVQNAQSMGFAPSVQVAIAQHHEAHDASGFPKRIGGEQLGVLGRILALVNRYDNLVNPAKIASALTPHEALALTFNLHKSKCEPTVLSAFIRMMGVYPPGSVVQLSDERYALVMSVNSSRPLKPSVLVHDTRVPRHEALIVDLQKTPELSVRRSVRPAQLPEAASQYLAPRQRLNYFFEMGVDSNAEGQGGP